MYAKNFPVGTRILALEPTDFYLSKFELEAVIIFELTIR